MNGMKLLNFIYKNNKICVKRRQNIKLKWIYQYGYIKMSTQLEFDQILDEMIKLQNEMDQEDNELKKKYEKRHNETEQFIINMIANGERIDEKIKQRKEQSKMREEKLKKDEYKKKKVLYKMW